MGRLTHPVFRNKNECTHLLQNDQRVATVKKSQPQPAEQPTERGLAIQISICYKSVHITKWPEGLNKNYIKVTAKQGLHPFRQHLFKKKKIPSGSWPGVHQPRHRLQETQSFRNSIFQFELLGGVAGGTKPRVSDHVIMFCPSCANQMETSHRLLITYNTHY